MSHRSIGSVWLLGRSKGKIIYCPGATGALYGGRVLIKHIVNCQQQPSEMMVGSSNLLAVVMG
eukprot:13937935-Heterocapsa_arctica.AAC.1